jgi:hypothetical protein
MWAEHKRHLFSGAEGALGGAGPGFGSTPTRRGAGVMSAGFDVIGSGLNSQSKLVQIKMRLYHSQKRKITTSSR